MTRLFKQFNIFAVGLLAVGLSAGCATPPSTPAPSAEAAKPVPSLGSLIEAQSATAKKPSVRSPGGLVITQTEEAPKTAKIKGPRFTLSAQDVDVKTILLALGKEIHQNIVVDPVIDKKATVDLKGVTLVEALDSLLIPLNLRYEIDKEFIRVLANKMETRVFHLNYIISKRQGSSNVQASSGSGVGGASSSSSSSSGSGATTSGGSTTGQRTSSSINTQETTDLWTEITLGLQQMVTGGLQQSGTAPPPGTATTPAATDTSALGASATPASLGASPAAPAAAAATTGSAPSFSPLGAPNRGFFAINKQAGVIVVKDYPANLLKVAEFLEAVEGSAQRQVFIQAKILEVALNNNYQAGIDWSQVSPINLSKFGPAGAGGWFLTSSGTGTVATAPITTTSSTGTTTTPGGTTPTPILSLGFGTKNVNVVLDALSQQGRVSVLSSPKIATLNNQRAVIKVGTEAVFFVPQTTTIQGASTTQYIPSTVTIGIVLDVLPQINADGNVMLSISTSISEQTGVQVSPDGLNKIPILNVRESNNVVLAGNDQTIVIGGLMKDKKTRQNNAVPILGDIPVIGRAFQHQGDTDEKTELVLILTPQVLAGAAMDDRLKEEKSVYDKFEFPPPQGKNSPAFSTPPL